MEYLLNEDADYGLRRYNNDSDLSDSDRGAVRLTGFVVVNE